MKRKTRKKFKKLAICVAFQMGVNVVGIPEIMAHVIRYTHGGYIAGITAQKFQA